MGDRSLDYAKIMGEFFRTHLEECMNLGDFTIANHFRYKHPRHEERNTYEGKTGDGKGDEVGPS